MLMNEMYKSQVALVLDTLPEIAIEENLALHGGTAINLFIRNMPRMSVDIDLTYTEISDRESSFENLSIFKENNGEDYHTAVQKLEDFLT